MLIPQRYKFSSKSQQDTLNTAKRIGCCWYHKGTNFQANHNYFSSGPIWFSVVADTTKVQIFKQITTPGENGLDEVTLLLIPQRYKFSSKSQQGFSSNSFTFVVADTTKVQIFKQITTSFWCKRTLFALLLIPQRYKFSSKSQQCQLISGNAASCCWYHKGTNFQANHNKSWYDKYFPPVVADTTKVQIFKQITTKMAIYKNLGTLLLIPQRYKFSSKSQHNSITR